ncbi:MAG TPA: SpoIIE family protein phosphatase [Candidatus Lustribacter sp.]|nr:SpoIIE family protein phosphatase [Candidatus Lustribacter sp.]
MSPPILLLLAAFVAVAVVGPVWGVRQLDAESSAQVRLAAARESVDAIFREQLSEEAGLRGFVSTHDRSFLDPDGPPDQQFDQRFAELEKNIQAAGLPEAVPVVEQVRTLHADWERQVARPLLADPGRPNSLQLQTFGKLYTDELRTASEQLRDQLRDMSLRQEAQLRRTINLTVGISAAIVALFALAAVMLGLGRATAQQRLEHEHSLVDSLQQTLRVTGNRLPRTEVGYAYASATAEALVGGDLLDLWRDGPETGWFLIADASGKGIQAARHAAFVQYALRALAAERDDPGIVVERFNRLFIDTFEDPGIFVVLFLGRFDARTHTLRYVGAGHSTAFVRRGPIVEQLPPTGPIVGLGPDSTFGVGSVNVPVGATVVLATDGLTEARDKNGTFLGDEGVAALLAAAPKDAQGVADFLLAEAERRYDGTIADDLAIMAITVRSREDGTDPGFSTMEAAPRR